MIAADASVMIDADTRELSVADAYLLFRVEVSLRALVFGSSMHAPCRSCGAFYFDPASRAA